MYVCLWILFFLVVFFDLNIDNELGIFWNSILYDVDFYDLEVNFIDSLVVGKVGIGLLIMLIVLFYMLVNLVVGKYIILLLYVYIVYKGVVFFNEYYLNLFCFFRIKSNSILKYYNILLKKKFEYKKLDIVNLYVIMK